MRASATASLALLALALGAGAPTGHSLADPYTVTKDPGNFTIDTATMSTSDGKFVAGADTTLTVTGVTKKQIVAGTVKYQIYETGVPSFIASGSSAFFQCDNKGCDITKPVSLNLADKSGDAGSSYTLTIALNLPSTQSGSSQFRIVLWTEDQDHFPYDMSLTFSYGLRTSDVAANFAALRRDKYTVTDVQPGNFSVSQVTMESLGGRDRWLHGIKATISVRGETKKQIDAGTVKYQVYETGVRSFIASGSESFFQCNNKGCDRNRPIALKLHDTSGKPGPYELTFSLHLPSTSSSSKDFKIVFWAADQDHFPYDMSATVAYTLEN